MWRWRSCGEGSFFPDRLLERRRRAERAPHQCGRDLLSAVDVDPPNGWAGAVVGYHRLLEVASLSEMAKELDAQGGGVSHEAVGRGPYKFLVSDELVIEVRQHGRVVKIAVLVATVINVDGHREMVLWREYHHH